MPTWQHTYQARDKHETAKASRCPKAAGPDVLAKLAPWRTESPAGAPCTAICLVLMTDKGKRHTVTPCNHTAAVALCCKSNRAVIVPKLAKQGCSDSLPSDSRRTARLPKFPKSSRVARGLPRRGPCHRLRTCPCPAYSSSLISLLYSQNENTSKQASTGT